MSEEAAEITTDLASFVQANIPAGEPAPKAETETVAEAIVAEPKAEPKVEAKEEPKPEPKPEPKTEAAVEAKERAADRIAKLRQLADKEKAAQERRREDQTRQEQARELEELRMLRKRLAEDPLSALESTGITYNTLTDKYVEKLEKNPGDPKLTLLERKLQDIESRLMQSQQESQQDQQRAVLEKFQSDLRLAATKGDYAFLQAEDDGGISETMRVTHEYWQKYETVLSPEEACEIAEERLEEIDRKREAARKKKFAPATATKAPEPKSEAKVETLTAELSRSAAHEPKERDFLEEQLAWVTKQRGA
jgi:hypothetical protein